MEEVDKEMEEIGKEMIKHCGGLPLAVRVLGGLLAAKYTLHEWKRVSENIGSHIMGITDLNEENINHILSLSFEELPSYLKHCFLYLAHFPEDYQISVEQLSYYWAAEGILKPRYYDGETIRGVGDFYIEELVRRNMVISERDIRTLRFEKCRLHDVMRELCLLKAKEENFLQINGISPRNANSQPRRSIWQYPTTFNVEREINNPKLRSLLIFCYYNWEIGEKTWTLSGLCFRRLVLLRVLDLYKAEFDGGELPSSIGKLIHLRYLNLAFARVSHLPLSLRNLKLLIYLNIAVYAEAVFVPNVLMGMQELRYLALPRGMDSNTKLELSNLVNLETLNNFSTEKSSLEDLRGMKRLRTLKIIVTEETSIKLSVSLGGLRNLESLDIDSYGFVRDIETRFLFNLVHLRNLFISHCGLPDQQHFASNLTCLYLSGCRLEEDPMPILEKLRHLKEVNLWFESFRGRRMVCSSGGFPQLQKLFLVGLEELEEWIIEKGSMPLLYTLTIHYCKKLEEVPHGLRYITSLKDLTVNKKWEKRLSRGGEDYYKVQRILSIIFTREWPSYSGLRSCRADLC